MKNGFLTTTLALGVLSVLAANAPAAIVTGSAVGAQTFPLSITNAGTSGWAYFNSLSSTTYTTLAAANSMKNAPVTISAISAIGGGLVRGSATPTNASYTFTNGTTSASGSSGSISGAFNSQLNTLNAGVGLTITLPDTQTYIVDVWVSGFTGTGLMTASLAGATTYTNSDYVYDSGNKIARLYQFTVAADQPNDVLNIAYTLKVGGSNANVLITGVAVSAVNVPEPASLGAIGLGATALLLRRRKA